MDGNGRTTNFQSACDFDNNLASLTVSNASNTNSFYAEIHPLLVKAQHETGYNSGL
jgi:hypothetical protein